MATISLEITDTVVRFFSNLLTLDKLHAIDPFVLPILYRHSLESIESTKQEQQGGLMTRGECDIVSY